MVTWVGAGVLVGMGVGAGVGGGVALRAGVGGVDVGGRVLLVELAAMLSAVARVGLGASGRPLAREVVSADRLTATAALPPHADRIAVVRMTSALGAGGRPR